MTKPQDIELLIEQLESLDPKVHSAALDAIVDVGALAVVPLSHAIRRTQLSYVPSALRLLGPVAIDILLQVLAVGDLDAQLDAMSALSFINDKRIAEPIIGCLNSSHVEIRRKAAQMMGTTISDPRAVIPLIDCLSDSDLLLSTNAAYALGRLGDKRAVVSLLQMAENRDPTKRYASLLALGNIGDKQALALLFRHLKDPSKRVRKSAKSALSRFYWRRRGQ